MSTKTPRIPSYEPLNGEEVKNLMLLRLEALKNQILCDPKLTLKSSFDRAEIDIKLEIRSYNSQALKFESLTPPVLVPDMARYELNEARAKKTPTTSSIPSTTSTNSNDEG
jgi:hypothetical protein